MAIPTLYTDSLLLCRINVRIIYTRLKLKTNLPTHSPGLLCTGRPDAPVDKEIGWPLSLGLTDTATAASPCKCDWRYVWVVVVVVVVLKATWWMWDTRCAPRPDPERINGRHCVLPLRTELSSVDLHAVFANICILFINPGKSPRPLVSRGDRHTYTQTDANPDTLTWSLQRDAVDLSWGLWLCLVVCCSSLRTLGGV